MGSFKQVHHFKYFVSLIQVVFKKLGYNIHEKLKKVNQFSLFNYQRESIYWL